MKMLFWKEWREIRGIILLGLLAVLLLWGDLVFKLPSVLAQIDLPLLLYMFTCSLVGGGLVARETNMGTLPFLLSLPVSRVRIMAAKALTSALLLFILASLGIFVVLFESSGEKLLPFIILRLALPILGLGLSYFASALFFSSFLDKTITAVIAGLAIASLLSFFVYSPISRSPSLGALILIGISAFLVLISFLIFARKEVK